MRVLVLTLSTAAFIVLVVLLIGKGQQRIAEETAQADTVEAPAAPASVTDAPASAGAGKAAAMLEPVAAPQPAPVPPSAKAAAKKEDPKPAFQILALPAVVAPGVLETTRGRVNLKGIVSPQPLALCGEGAAAWPCGQIAVTQLQRFLRARSLDCDIADAFWQGEVTARCMLGDEDVAGWLVENGWARAEMGSGYEAAGRQAEREKRGIYGPDPRTR